MLQLWIAAALAGEVDLKVTTVDFLASANLERSVSPVLTRLHVVFEDWLQLAMPPLLPLEVQLVSDGDRFGRVEITDGVSTTERIGYFDPSNRRVVAWHRGDDGETRRVVQHEVAHYYAHAAGLARVPDWLGEGLAEVGASATLDARGFVWLEPMRWGKAALSRRPRPRASALIGLDEATWGSLGLGAEYPYGWALCAFFLETERGRRALSEVLLSTFAGDDPGGAALAAVERTWPGGVADLDAAFARWTPVRIEVPARVAGPAADGWGHCPDGSLIRLDAGARCSRWLAGPDGVMRFVEEAPVR